jgi:hypothetical protein
MSNLMLKDILNIANEKINIFQAITIIITNK